MYSEWDDPNFDSPSRWPVYYNFISKKGINCVTESSHGMTASLREEYPNLSKDEEAKYIDRLRSQWTHMYKLAIEKYKQDKLEDRSPLDKVFDVTPTVCDKIDTEYRRLIRNYSDRELQILKGKL